MMAYKLSILCHYKICVFGPRFVERMVHQAIIALETPTVYPLMAGRCGMEMNSPKNLQPPNDLTCVLFEPISGGHATLFTVVFWDHAMGLIHFFLRHGADMCEICAV